MNRKQVLEDAVICLEIRESDLGMNMYTKASTIASTLLDKRVSPYDITMIEMALNLAKTTSKTKGEDSWISMITSAGYAAQYSSEKLSLPEAVVSDNMIKIQNDIAETVEQMKPFKKA